MSVTRRDWLTDRFSLAVGGHNSGDDKEYIDATQYADSKNITNRGGRVRGRPRFVKKADLPTDPANDLFFQGITHFKSLDQIVLRANGRLYRLDDNTTDPENAPCVFTEVMKPNVTVWEIPTAQVDTITVTGGSGSITVNLVATVGGTVIDDSVTVAWNTDLDTTCTDIADAIDDMASPIKDIVNAVSTGGGTGEIVLTSEVAGRGFITTVSNSLTATVETTTPNYHYYLPNEAIPQGDTAGRPGSPVEAVAQVDTITISAGTNSPGVNTIDVYIDGNKITAGPVDWVTSHAATATALATAINADPNFSGILTADASAGDGTLTLTCDLRGDPFNAYVINAGDVESSIVTTTEPSFPENSIYYDWDVPSLLIYNGSNWVAYTENLTIDIPLDANPLRDQVWFEEVAGTLVIQDGQKLPIQYDGSNWNNLTTVPIGTAMRFANNRLHLVSSGQRKTVTVGDILQNGDATTALKFTESGYLLGGGSFAFPDEIRALHEIPVQDTASGQGSMIVGTTRNMHSLRTEITDRDLWSSVEGFQSPILPSIGIAGPYSIVAVNNDLYFRSTNGLRSLRMAVGEQQDPGYGGLQQEIPEKFYPWGLLHNSSIHSGDRFVTLVQPRLEDHQWVYEGAVSINFESINRLGQKSGMSFDGFWTLPDDHYFRQIFDADGTGYAVVSTSSGDELWELQKDGSELTVESGLEQILVTRAMHANDPLGLKTLGRMDVWVSHIQDDLSIEFEYRVDQESDWRTWHTLDITQGASPTKDYVSRYTLPTAPGNKVSGYTFQFRVKWTGRCRIDYMQCYLKPLAESNFAEQLTPISLT